jgi:hypothetical protein
MQMQAAEERMAEAITTGTPVSQVMDRRYESMTDPTNALAAPTGPA